MKNTIHKLPKAQENFLLSEEDMSNPNMKKQIQLIEKLKPQMSLALPKHMNSDRLARIALTEMRQTPLLQECEPESLMKCLMISAQLGLEPGLLGHCYFVPFKEYKKKRPDGQPQIEANLIIGYKGMLDLARRSGQVESIEARMVCENDICEVRFGLDSGIDHRIDIRKERGEPIGYYAIAKLVGGGKQFEFMSKLEVDAVKEKSKAKDFGPWKDYYDEMAKKTCIRRLFKYLPVSIEMQKAINLDEYAEAGIQKQTIDTDFFDVDIETGEILEPENEKPKSQAETLADKIK